MNTNIGLIVLCAIITLSAHLSLSDYKGSWRRVASGLRNRLKVRLGSRIVNGAHASIEGFPFMVSIQIRHYHWNHCCGGSIVNPTVILTACHCVTEGQKIVENNFRLANPENMRVVAGSTDWSTHSPGQQIVKVGGLKAHPRCSNFVHHNGMFNYDVGLVLLRSPLTFTEVVQPIKIVSPHVETALRRLKNIVYSGMPCYTPGWGLTVEQTRSVTTRLMVATVRIMTSQQCRNRFCHLANTHCHTDFYNIHQMCTISADQSNCFGDSGGPLVCNGFVYGTVSYGIHCHPGWPTVFQHIKPIIEILNWAYGQA